MTLEQGLAIAAIIEDLIGESCTRFDIAGSIRREKETPKDIEILITPKDRGARNKIGIILLAAGIKRRKGTFAGRYIQFLFMNQVIDMFIPQEHDYFRQLAIRTGSANYSKRIATRWSANGYIGTAEGLKHKSLEMEAEKPITWESEKDFFNWLGMKWIEPKNRL